MPTLLQGEYREGVVTLRERPTGIVDGRVRVLLLPEHDPTSAPRMLRFGKYRGERMSKLEDFREAEWHGREGLGD